MSTDKMAGEAPIVPASYSHSPLSAPQCGPPIASRKQLSVDVTSPSNLSPKQSQPVGYAEVSVSCFNVKVVVKIVNIP